jgi:hypothetical protein
MRRSRAVTRKLRIHSQRRSAAVNLVLSCIVLYTALQLAVIFAMSRQPKRFGVSAKR